MNKRSEVESQSVLRTPDEEKARVARILTTVLLLSVGMDALISVGSLFLPFDKVPTIASVTTLIVLQLGLPLAVRKRHVVAAGRGFLFALWTILTTLTVLFSGVAGVAPIGYMSVILIAGLVLGGRGAVFFTALCIATELCVLCLDTMGGLPEILMSTSLPMFSFTRIAGFAVLGVGLSYSLRLLDTALEEGAWVVGQGVHLGSQTSEVIQQLATVTKEAAQTAVQAQASALSLASTHQTEKAARHLSDLAESLIEIVQHYQLQALPEESYVE